MSTRSCVLFIALIIGIPAFAQNNNADLLKRLKKTEHLIRGQALPDSEVFKENLTMQKTIKIQPEHSDPGAKLQRFQMPTLVPRLPELGLIPNAGDVSMITNQIDPGIYLNKITPFPLTPDRNK